ncbi:MAG: TSUP family transporter [Thermoproteus sp. AZ2]|jgi:uncharacterized membrane protein YfcA|uniref:TSUP family transporter n=1 Tax=Thermoproteus sp. AZ2 TaxID=1609232 RepID=A0ACC6UYL1_9CREN
MELWAIALLGLAAGALVGLTGSSGVAVVVPALTYMGFSFQRAVAASLAVDVLATSLAVAVYLRAGYVDMGAAAIMGAAAVAGALLGSHIAVRLPGAPLQLAFAASSAYFAYTSIINAKRGSDVGLMPLVRSMMRRLPTPARWP